MVSSSILVLCSAFSADASDPVIDLPDVIVKPAVTPDVLAFDFYRPLVPAWCPMAP